MKLKPKQKKLAALLVVSLLLGYLMTHVSSVGIIGGGPTGVWQKVIAQAEPAFEVMMPGVPRHTINQVSLASFGETLPTTSIISEDRRGQEYVLNIIALSEPMKSLSSETIFKEAIKLLTAAENTILLSFNVDQDQADFQIVRSDQGPSMQGRIILKDSYLFLQSVSYTEGHFLATDYQKFIQSLALQ